MHVLLVDDDPHARLEAELTAEGHRVFRAHTLAQADAIELGAIDVAIVASVVGDGDGFAWCVRAKTSFFSGPMLLLGAERGAPSAARALAVGLDDFVKAPYAVEEIAARVHALGRRLVPVERLALGPLRLDVFRRLVFADGKMTASLNRREAELLAYLARTGGRIVTSRELAEALWGMGEPARNHVHVAVSRLREKLGPYAPLVRTVWSKGYRLDTSEEALYASRPA